MKFLITDSKSEREKREIRSRGLYCYDLRLSDDGDKIATIETSVTVNNVGSIITNEQIIIVDKINQNYVDYESFIVNNEQVDKIEELLEKVLTIKQIGVDNWDRPIYKDEKGTVYKDVNLGTGEISLCTSVNNDFYGEPYVPIRPEVKLNIVDDFKKSKSKER